MIIKWKMSIGYPGACQRGEVEIDPEDLEGLNDEQRRDAISQAIWDDAIQYVDVYEVEDE